jgi:hypothetical protein
MSAVLMIQGKPETVFDYEHFARLLDEKLGYEAAEYFRAALEDQRGILMDEMAKEPLNFCTGECDRVYEAQRHYQDVLRDVLDDLRAYYNEQLALRSPRKLFMLADVIKKVGNEL